MRKKLQVKKIVSILSIVGLVVLILLSPCKVRNYIQSELGIPQTKVTNKSQSTISQSNCQTSEVSKTVQTVSKPTFQQSDLLSSEAYHVKTPIEPSHLSSGYNSSRNNSTAVVPLYILFQNLKIYS